MLNSVVCCYIMLHLTPFQFCRIQFAMVKWKHSKSMTPSSSASASTTLQMLSTNTILLWQVAEILSWGCHPQMQYFLTTAILLFLIFSEDCWNNFFFIDMVGNVIHNYNGTLWKICQQLFPKMFLKHIIIHIWVVIHQVFSVTSSHARFFTKPSSSPVSNKINLASLAVGTSSPIVSLHMKAYMIIKFFFYYFRTVWLTLTQILSI